MFGSNCSLLTCIQVSQEAGKVVWYSHLFKNFPQFVVIHTVKGFSMVNEAEVGVFLEFSYKMCIYNMCILNFRASLLAQLVKNLPATQEIQLDSLVG